MLSALSEHILSLLVTSLWLWKVLECWLKTDERYHLETVTFVAFLKLCQHRKLKGKYGKKMCGKAKEQKFQHWFYDMYENFVNSFFYIISVC